MNRDSTGGGIQASLKEFLAGDFARLDAGLIARCMNIEGHRLYIAGATGYFGKNILALLAFLEEQGASFQVTALSRHPERFLAQQPWCRELRWLEWRQGDARSPWPGEGNYDVLLHAATDTSAHAHLDNSDVFEGIVDITRHALKFVANRGVRRVVLCGSGAEYGEIPEETRDGLRVGIAESSAVACDPTLVGSAYGEAKRVSEMLTALRAERDGFSVLNARCFAFVGPGLPLDGHFAVGNFIRDALSIRTIKLASSGDSIRSYLYGADLAVWLLILMLEAAPARVINVGSDHAICIADVARLVRDLVSPGVEVVLGPRTLESPRNFYLPSIRRARDLGLDMWTDLNTAIRRTALWYGQIR